MYEHDTFIFGIFYYFVSINHSIIQSFNQSTNQPTIWMNTLFLFSRKFTDTFISTYASSSSLSSSSPFNNIYIRYIIYATIAWNSSKLLLLTSTEFSRSPYCVVPYTDRFTVLKNMTKQLFVSVPRLVFNYFTIFMKPFSKFNITKKTSSTYLVPTDGTGTGNSTIQLTLSPDGKFKQNALRRFLASFNTNYSKPGSSSLQNSVYYIYLNFLNSFDYVCGVQSLTYT